MRGHYRGRRQGWRQGRHYFQDRIRRSDGRRLYRPPNGKIFGVCAGLANYFDLSVRGVRIVAIILLIFTGFWPLAGIYVLAAMLMKPAPAGYEYQTRFQQDPAPEPEEDYQAQRATKVDRLKKTFDDLNDRLRNMEDKVTAKEFDWERRYNQS